MLVSRLFATSEAATEAVGDLKQSGFREPAIHVVDNTGEHGSEAAMRKLGVHESRAKTYAEGVSAGRVLLIVEAPPGAGNRAAEILNRRGRGGGQAGEDEAEVSTAEFEALTRHERAPADWNDDATPLSRALGWRVLLNDPTPFSAWIGKAVLSDNPTPLSSWLGRRVLSDNPAPLSSSLGWRTLSHNPTPLSGWIGKSVLLDNPTPLSSKLNRPVLKDDPTPLSNKLNRKVLSDNPTPLSSWLGLPVLSRDPPSRA